MDDTGHSWTRVSNWVEPSDAERLVRTGTRFMVQECSSPPVVVRPERFRRDVRARMITAAGLGSHEGRSRVPTIMVGELWRSADCVELLLFVEQDPRPRGAEELQDSW